MNFDLDLVIVTAFLFSNLIVGLIYGKNVKTIQDYALGGRNFSTSSLVATIVATFMTGSGFFVTLNKTYTDGLPYLFAVVCISVQYVIIALFIVPKFERFIGYVSVAEVMGHFYGKHVRMLTAITAIMWNVGGIAVQFKVLGNVLSYFAQIPEIYGVLFASSMVVIYSTFGGIRAVTYTDILQFFTFGFVIPLIGIVMWNEFQNSGMLVMDSFNNEIFTLEHIAKMNFVDKTNFLLLALYFLLPSVGPIHFQRMSMGKSISQVKKAFLISAFLFLVVDLAIAWMPFLLKGLHPDIESKLLYSFIIDNYAFTGLKGLIIIGVCAMAMSSADSFINGSAVLFGHDLKEALNIKVDPLILSKLFSLWLGVFAVYMALSTDDLLNMVMSTASLYISMILAPLLLSILGFRTSTKVILYAMAASFITVILWRFVDIKIQVIIPALVVNVIVLFTLHYTLRVPGGWEKVEVVQPKKVGPTFWQQVQSFDLKACLAQRLPTNDISYLGVGVYFVVLTFSTMYSTSFALSEPGSTPILAMYQVMMITGVLITTYPIWPLSIPVNIKRKVASVAWYASITYMLVLFSTFFVMVSKFSTLQFTIFTTNLLVVIHLFGWRIASVVIPITFFAGIELYKFYKGVDHVDFSIGSPLFVAMYSLFLIGTVLTIFLRPQEEQKKRRDQEIDDLTDKNKFLDEKIDLFSEKIKYQEKEIARLGDTAKRILNNLNHELRLPVGNVMNFAEMLSGSLKKYNKKQLKELSDEVYKNSNRLSSMILNMLDLATIEINRIDLQRSKVDLSELIRERVKNCVRIYLDNKPLDFELHIEPEVVTFVDVNYMRQVIDNLVINAITYSNSGTIRISLQCSESVIAFTIEDEGIGIPRKDIYDVFEPFTTSSATFTPAEGRGVGLSLCRSAIEAHDGLIYAESNGTKGAKFVFVLPRI